MKPQNGERPEQGQKPSNSPIPTQINSGDPFPAHLEHAARMDGRANAWTADELRALKKACWAVLKRNIEELSTYPGLEERTAKKVGAKLRRMYEENA